MGIEETVNILGGLIGMVLIWFILRVEWRRSKRIRAAKRNMTTQCRGSEGVPADAVHLYTAPRGDDDLQGDLWIKGHEIYAHRGLLGRDAEGLSELYRKVYLCVSLKDVVDCSFAPPDTVCLLMQGIVLEVEISFDKQDIAEKIHAQLKAEVERLNAVSQSAA